MLLAGDIGGTKTRLAIIDPQVGPRAPVAEATFVSRDYDSLEAVIRAFLVEVHAKIESASFGVAGPVVEGRAVATNLPWVIAEAQLKAQLDLSGVHLINDLQAIASAVPWLQPEDLFTLNAGQAVPGAAIAVIAPGTGLGEAFLTYACGRYHAYPSEGGHTDFAPATRDEITLAAYLFDKLGHHVSYERVCSGIGIPNIYSYVRDTGFAAEPAWLAEELKAAKDRTPIIVNNALDPERSTLICRETLARFVSILGSEAGNLAMKVLATGGVYLGGGIPPRIIPALQHPRFMAAFCNKGRMEPWLAKVPIYVITNPVVALLGAAYYGLEEEGLLP